jgi:hypothetical protein
VRQVGYLQELNRVARSTKHKKRQMYIVSPLRKQQFFFSSPLLILKTVNASLQIQTVPLLCESQRIIIVNIHIGWKVTLCRLFTSTHGVTFRKT